MSYWVNSNIPGRRSPPFQTRYGERSVAIHISTISICRDADLTIQQFYTLESQNIRDLIANETITLDQALGFGPEHRRALEDAVTRERLRNGDLTIDNIMGGPVHHHADGAAAVVPNINDGQSTHHASVHQTVSESANRLAYRYQLVIDGEGLEKVISSVQNYVDKLSDNSSKNKAAKSCVYRISEPNYTFTDPGSQISTRQLLALTFLAIHDDENRTGSLEDARARFVEGLYEIQRGYNLSELGVDQGGQDKFICSAGTFNKLIEKLQAIHPDCQILFITKQTASLKLPIVVKEEAMRYFASLANPSTAGESVSFTNLMVQVKEDGVEVIWNQIKGNITNRMFDEFGSLYQDRADRTFTDFIDAGKYTTLPDLSIFQKQLQNSKGYHQFCNQALHGPSIFSSRDESAGYPSNHQPCS